MEDKELNPKNQPDTPQIIEIDPSSTEDSATPSSLPPEEDTAPCEKATEAPSKGGKLLELFKKNKALVIVIAVLVVAITFGLAILLVNVLGVDTSATFDEATVTTSSVATVATEAPGTEDTTWPDGTPYDEVQDWDALKKINSDIKGWVTLRNTNINYPVLKSEEDGVGKQYYLHRGYDKSYDYAGSIFIDYRSSEGVKSRNVLTHGHSMADGSMYMDLVSFGEFEPDMEFYRSTPTLFFNTPEGNEQYIIFAVVKTNTLASHGDFFNFLMGDFDNDAQFMNYVYNMKIRSIIDIPVPINENDDIITLSTCSYEYDEFRTVVCARKLRNNEKVNAYIDAAKPAENPVWPDIYYYNHEGSRPEVTTFRTEYELGTIDWYDGKGNLEGNEWLVLTSGTQDFIVTFVNYDGSIISTQSVHKGEAAVAPDDPVKPDSDGHSYKFVGWQVDFSSVSSNMIIAPNFVVAD